MGRFNLKLEYERDGDIYRVLYRDEVVTEIDMTPEFPWLDYAGQLNKLPVHALDDDEELLRWAGEVIIMLSKFHDTNLSEYV